MTRLKSRFLVDLLLRRTEAAGGFATVLAQSVGDLMAHHQSKAFIILRDGQDACVHHHLAAGLRHPQRFGDRAAPRLFGLFVQQEEQNG